MFCMRTRSALAAHPLKNAFQRVQAVIVDDQFAAPAAALLHGDAGVEDLAQFSFQIFHLGVCFFAHRRFAVLLALRYVLHSALDFTHRPSSLFFLSRQRTGGVDRSSSLLTST